MVEELIKPDSNKTLSELIKENGGFTIRIGSRLSKIITLTIIGVSLTTGYYFSKGINSTNKSYQSHYDLNNDSSQNDFILESIGGHKTPLYAHVKNDGNIEYLSGYEMKKLDPNSIVDYPSIEDKLNSKQ